MQENRSKPKRSGAWAADPLDGGTGRIVRRLDVRIGKDSIPVELVEPTWQEWNRVVRESLTRDPATGKYRSGDPLQMAEAVARLVVRKVEDIEMDEQAWSALSPEMGMRLMDLVRTEIMDRSIEVDEGNSEGSSGKPQPSLRPTSPGPSATLSSRESSWNTLSVPTESPTEPSSR